RGARNFPFRKEESDLDVALEDGAGDDEYIPALEYHLASGLARHAPDFAFYLAGADPYDRDRLGRRGLTVAGRRRRDEIVLAACRARGLPVAISMSGGYADDVEDIVRIHANTVAAAAALDRTLQEEICHRPSGS